MLFAKLKKVWQAYEKLDEALYPLIGLHQYKKYLKHFNKHHPGEQPLSRAQFFREAQDAKAKNVKC
ncbi:CstA-like transporter-associated (seleno)protein [Campylobacter hyointestinalis]|uniref:CstA-like transporter-associated (seleno)protein n=1 Tax=Campylobacter hyointestinalis TaxID=198 RepID=UPI000CE457A3|nr:CstA-like transporter-associated (seleno)protein [Campylobacter hyointestinalis]PPB66503.1 hypothetical protein CDQ75_03415 [Campylobacter hyointestinalis subsp. hyointestinalis]